MHGPGAGHLFFAAPCCFWHDCWVKECEYLYSDGCDSILMCACMLTSVQDQNHIYELFIGQFMPGNLRMAFKNMQQTIWGSRGQQFLFL